MLGSGVLLITAAGISYLGTLYLSWPLVEAHLIKGRYPGLYDTLMMWSIFAVLNIPSICISIYLQAGHKYRQLAVCGGLSALSSSLLLGMLIFRVPTDWAVAALILGEAVMTAGLLKLMRDELMGLPEHGSFHRSIS